MLQLVWDEVRDKMKSRKREKDSIDIRIKERQIPYVWRLKNYFKLWNPDTNPTGWIDKDVEMYREAFHRICKNTLFPALIKENDKSPLKDSKIQEQVIEIAFQDAIGLVMEYMKEQDNKGCSNGEKKGKFVEYLNESCSYFAYYDPSLTGLVRASALDGAAAESKPTPVH